jgi:hypothetical protein
MFASQNEPVAVCGALETRRYRHADSARKHPLHKSLS